MRGPVSADTRWLRRFRAAEHAPVRLVCFPHAGGSAGFYFPFAQALTPDAEVIAVQYPGRQDRLNEPGVDDIGRLADGVLGALLPSLDERPLALFGHSMGAVVAYEAARRLEHEFRAAPALLFASGRRAPCRHRDEYTHLKNDAGLMAELRELGGTNADLLAEEGLLRMFLPAVRVDYRAIETYRHRSGPEPSCPIAVLTGAEDPKVTLDEAADWRHHTTGECTLDVFPGRHFFLTDAAEDVVRLVTGRLRRLAPGAVR
ncbi:alpha/beta fold hydrolase [Streptomyces sp. JB150]|uniref:thioesterase II family protein n=1 Tax=Streptomyces sp. JB150 TaxID=2714844 RepID=UPI00140768EA|nr:alpha/beta fold hydrolase [Streptomyces sp. JB150]QIJ65464.1 thioesterase [Streptomyces sp. JB150]